MFCTNAHSESSDWVRDNAHLVRQFVNEWEMFANILLSYKLEKKEAKKKPSSFTGKQNENYSDTHIVICSQRFFPLFYSQLKRIFRFICVPAGWTCVWYYTCVESRRTDTYVQMHFLICRRPNKNSKQILQLPFIIPYIYLQFYF